MKNTFKLLVAFIFPLTACAASCPATVTEYSEPGRSVTRKGNSTNLIGNAIPIGITMPSVELVESDTIKSVDLSHEKGKILFLGIVPSFDTKVCEEQTHYLEEKGDHLSPNVKRITISRDTTFAHQRFAEEANLLILNICPTTRRRASARQPAF
ncbi:MAG: redoxin domain-containing protein [Desulfobacterales bacterium]|jgi:thiol peroxidase